MAEWYAKTWYTVFDAKNIHCTDSPAAVSAMLLEEESVPEEDESGEMPSETEEMSEEASTETGTDLEKSKKTVEKS